MRLKHKQIQHYGVEKMAGNQDITDAKSGYEAFIRNLKRSTIAVAIVTIIVVAIIASRA
jgi:hypothetical protein